MITAVFILSRLLLAILGETQAGEDLRALALAAAYAIMAAAVWLYHGWLLREDRRALETVQDQRAAQKNIIVLDAGALDDSTAGLGQKLLDSLQAEFPAGTITRAAPGSDNLAGLLATADIVVGSWSMALAGDELQAALAASPARKLILPNPVPGWQWVKKETWDQDSAVSQAVETIETIIAGETAAPRLTLTPGVIILLIAATILILILLTSLLGTVLPIFN